MPSPDNKNSADKIFGIEVKSFEIVDMKSDDNDTDLYIKGTAVTTDISNKHRFPHDWLKADNTLAGKALIDWHSDFPYQISNNDIFGKILSEEFVDEGFYPDSSKWQAGQPKGRKDFVLKIWRDDIKQIVKELPDLIKFSVGFKHNFKTEEIKYKDGDENKSISIAVTTDGGFDHLGMLSRPADARAVPNFSKQQEELSLSKETKIETPIPEPTPEPEPENSDKSEADSKIETLEATIKAKDTEIEKLKKDETVLKTQFDSVQKTVDDLVKKQQEAELASKTEKINDYVEQMVEDGMAGPAEKEELVKHYMDFTPEQFEREQKINESRKKIQGSGIYDESSDSGSDDNDTEEDAEKKNIIT